MKGFYLRDAAGAIRYDAACHPIAATATEHYDYDDLQRLTGATRMWEGMNWQPPTTPADTYSYDDLGNITSKSDYGDQYGYGSAARTNGLAGPHAVTSISMAGFPKASFQYDQNGNLVHSDGPDGRNITFDDYDRPTKVVMGGVTTIFRYAPDGSRYLQQTTTSTGTKTVYYVGKEYQRVDWSSRPTEEQVYIGPSVVVYQSGSTRDVRYLHLDRLGSVEAVTTSTAAEAIADAHSFDAFGKPRARDWQANGDKLHPAGAYGATTEHGFTGHEHLDDTYLIHMNGRVYDYRMGRFLSVDPVISNPANSQSINPYSYIGNNPLSGVDPTGYCPDSAPSDTGSHICKPTQQTVLGKIYDALESGKITSKTTLDEASTVIGASITGAFNIKVVASNGSAGAGSHRPAQRPKRQGPARIVLGRMPRKVKQAEGLRIERRKREIGLL